MITVTVKSNGLSCGMPNTLTMRLTSFMYVMYVYCV